MGEDGDDRFIAFENLWPEPEGYFAGSVMDQIGPIDDASRRFVHARPTGSPVLIEFIEFVRKKLDILWTI